LIFHIPTSSVFVVCGTAAHRNQGTGFASLRVLDSGVLPCRWVTKAAKPPFAKGFDWL
jgi:hypothetical protein